MCFAFKTTISVLLKTETVERLHIMAECLPEVEDEWFRREQLAAQGQYPTTSRRESGPELHNEELIEDPGFFDDLEDFRRRRQQIEERKRERGVGRGPTWE